MDMNGVADRSGAGAAGNPRWLAAICCLRMYPQGLRRGSRFAFSSGRQIITGQAREAPLVWNGEHPAIPGWLGSNGEVAATQFNGELIVLSAGSLRPQGL